MKIKNHFVILVVDDEKEVLDSVLNDLDLLSEKFDIEIADNVKDAKDILSAMRKESRKLAIILCDHMMPGMRGVDFLIELNKDEYTKDAKKILLTGQAGLKSTVSAINHADLDYYISKPWDHNDLLLVVKDFLSYYIVENSQDLKKYLSVLNSEIILKKIHEIGY